MIFYMARNVQSSDCISEKYIKLNNCGWYSNCPLGFGVQRKNGRKDYQAIYVHSGKMRFNNKLVSAGGIFLYRPGESQLYSVTEENSSFYWIHFTGIAADRLFSSIDNITVQIGSFKQLTDFCKESVKLYNSHISFNEIFIEGMLLCVLAKFSDILLSPPSENAAANKAEYALRFINENYKKKVSNEDYARMCGITKFYFIKQFTLLTGTTPQKYRMRLILEKSCAMLAGTNLKINEISDFLGFEDSLYFSRAFRRRFGISPLYYRNSK